MRELKQGFPGARTMAERIDPEHRLTHAEETALRRAFEAFDLK